MNILGIVKRIFCFKNNKNKTSKISKEGRSAKSKDSNANCKTHQNIYTLLNNGDLGNPKSSIDKISCSIPEEQTLYKLSKFFSNFSDNTRLKIISCLSFGELCVTDISKILNMNQTTISHQLAYLKSSGTVTSRRDGKTIYYSLTTNEIENCLTCGANFIAI